MSFTACHSLLTEDNVLVDYLAELFLGVIVRISGNILFPVECRNGVS